MAIAKTSKKTPNAWVVSSKDRGRKSIKNGNVFLKDNEEFQIELFNPLKNNVLAKINLNGNPISKTGLVIRPGERVYLDCFLNDKKKFIFKTYDIENSEEALEATEENGLLEVYFYKESIVRENFYPIFDGRCYGGNYKGSGIFYDGNFTTNTGSGTFYDGNFTTTTINNVCYSDTSTVSLDSININDMGTLNSTKEVETGRIEKGEKSNQQFETVDMEFEDYYISSTIIKMLPDSRKPLESKDINKNNPDNVIELIKKLSELNDNGILNDEEFEEKKSELLSRI